MHQPAKTIHRKKFDGGRRTPHEYHRDHAFPPSARCLCGRKPDMRAIVMCPFDEANKRGMLPEGALLNPAIMQMIVEINEGGTPKPYLRISMTYACKSCGPDMEKALAKGPSWVIVEINRGPDPTNRVVLGSD